MDFLLPTAFILLLMCSISVTSLAQSSSCERCSQRPSSCRRITGLYTVTVLTRGTYNPVVEIPASACSVNVTELAVSNNFIGVKTARSKGIVNSYWAISGPGQYRGAGTTFSYKRRSSDCPTSCIFAAGPTTEKTVVQILYYNKNPGIAYDFLLPNSVHFQPFDGTKTSLSGTGESTSSAASSRGSDTATTNARTTTAHRSRHYHHSKHHRHQRQHNRRSQTHRRDHNPRPTHHHPVGRESRAEYYTGSQFSRSEGRPDETSAQSIVANYRRRVVPNQRTAIDYTSNKYGTHTLGGRGLSYTAASPGVENSQQKATDNSERSSVGTRESSRHIRKLQSPQYRSPITSNARLSYSRQRPHYRRFTETADASYRNDANRRGRNLHSGYSSRRSYDSGQFRWKIAGLTECSSSCGGGVQKTSIVCVSVGGRSRVVVTSENCANTPKPREQTMVCNTAPCEPAWEADEWSECSVTCGSGTQTRKIECRRKFSSTLTIRVSADQCGVSKKPAVAQQCEKALCSSWSPGAWGKCNKECGGGQQTRDVKCVDGLESAIPRNYCKGAKPRHRQACNTHKCSAKWWTSQWSSVCSESCGSGYKVRSALCLDGEGSSTNQADCEMSKYPELKKQCYGDYGCHGTWFTGSWGRCQAKCGQGKRLRPVICIQPKKGGLLVLATGKCNPNLKPRSEETCVNTDCNSLWFQSPWTQCSASCGEGYQSRDVSCIGKDGSPSERCEESTKPDTQQTCSIMPCSHPQRISHRRKLEKIDTQSAESDIQEFTAEIQTVKSKDQKEKKKEHEKLNRQKEKSCQDTFWNCKMVIQSRLCHYEYYRKLCCVSCPSL